MVGNTFRRKFLGLAGGGTLAAARASGQASSLTGGVCNVVEFGAPRNGRDSDTAAVQAAVDACGAHGGGTVLFPPGSYYCGGVRLHSGVHLRLEAGAVVRGSRNLDDYPRSIPALRSYTDNYTERSLLYAENCDNVGVHGDGVLDGHGGAFEGPYKVRPYMIRFVSCRGVSVSGVTLRDSPMWVQHYLACDDVAIHGITVHSLVNKNNDGIDIDACRRVTISGCNVRSGDDAIVLKSTLGRVTEDVTIANCILSSDCNAFKLGTESNGGFRNIVFGDCAIYGTRLSGIAIEMVDGGVLDNVSVSNVTMRDVRNPIFIRLGNRARPFTEGGARPGVGSLRNIAIRGLTATGAGATGCPVSGIPGHCIENVSIAHVRLTFRGRLKDPPPDVPENEDQYPEYRMFGPLPAYALFFRHVRNLRLTDVETGTDEPDERAAVVCHDVEGLEVRGSTFGGDAVPVRLKDVREALFSSCRLRGAPAAFLDVSAGGVRDVSVIGNDLSRARRAVHGLTREVHLAANRAS